MIEIRIHGRGGQGNVVAVYLLATAAFEAGRYSQAFPAFGAERRGAPVVAFVRIADKPFFRRNEVREPSFLIIQDSSLLHEPNLTSGLGKDGKILINSNLSSEAISKENRQEMLAMPASALALEVVGREMPNVALLSAFLTLTRIMPHDALAKALATRFTGEVLERNLELVDKAAKQVPEGLWKSVAQKAAAGKPPAKKPAPQKAGPGKAKPGKGVTHARRT